jgi:hypothetical protein
MTPPTNKRSRRVSYIICNSLNICEPKNWPQNRWSNSNSWQTLTEVLRNKISQKVKYYFYVVLMIHCIEKLLFETDNHFVKDQKTIDITQYSLQFSLAMLNHSFVYNLIRLLACKSKFTRFVLASPVLTLNIINLDILQDVEQQTNRQ